MNQTQRWRGRISLIATVALVTFEAAFGRQAQSPDILLILPDQMRGQPGQWHHVAVDNPYVHVEDGAVKRGACTNKKPRQARELHGLDGVVRVVDGRFRHACGDAK